MTQTFIILCLLTPQPSAAVPFDDATKDKLKAIAFQACRDGDVKTLEEYFKVGMPVDVLSPREDTLLAVAAYHGQLKAVEVILAQPKVDLEAKNRMGLTALAAAAFKGHTDILTALLDKKAKVNAANGSGQTALMFAALTGKAKAVEVLLKAGADATLADKDGKTAMSLAKEQGAKEVVIIFEKVLAKTKK